MAVYVICPHCGHPSVVSRRRAGKSRLCRQCAKMYFFEESAYLAAEAVPAFSTEDGFFFLPRASHSTRVPVLELA